MHTICSIFSPETAISFWSLPLCLNHFLPQPRNPSRSLPFIATEIHSTCPLIGILLFLYLCIPLFIRNHMLMKSVIINLKYLIFRSVSASEGGWLEEQQQRRWRRGERRRRRRVGGRGWKESCCSVSLICIRCFKVSSNQSRSTAVFFQHRLHLKSPKDPRPGVTTLHRPIFFFSRFSFIIALCPLAPSLNSIPSLSISSREAECPCDKVWGLSASDWQACSHHASACCLIRENVSVILGNVIYRGFLAVSVTQTDYGCWTFISLGVASENCTNAMFFCDNDT